MNYEWFGAEEQVGGGYVVKLKFYLRKICNVGLLINTMIVLNLKVSVTNALTTIVL